MDDVEGPPFIHVNEPLEMSVEGVEKRGLPVEIVRQPREHLTQATTAVFQTEQFVDEELGATLVNGGIRLGQLRRVRKVQFVEAQGRVGAQELADRSQRIRVALAADDPRCRLAG